MNVAKKMDRATLKTDRHINGAAWLNGVSHIVGRMRADYE